MEHWFWATPKRVVAKVEREWLAFSRDVGWAGAIAGKPAPTGYCGELTGIIWPQWVSGFVVHLWH
ncbi:hypothetical protein D3C76_1415830 [compost metagenome]